MKLSTPDLELLITNLKAFIVKVEEDKENKEYNMWGSDYCIYAKTLNTTWHMDEVSQMLLGKDYYDVGESRLFRTAFNLFADNPFTEEGYDCYHLTKQQWLKVANKVVLKLKKKLWKRQAKAVQKIYGYRLSDVTYTYSHIPHSCSKSSAVEGCGGVLTSNIKIN